MTRLRTFLVGTDFSHGAQAALQYAKVLAKTFNGRLIIVHAYDPVHLLADPIVGVPPGEYLAGHYPPRDKIHCELDAIARTVRSNGLPVETRMINGRAHVRLIQLALEIDAELIVLGTKGLTGIDRFMLGSTAEQVVRMAPCPVLTVRTPWSDDETGAPVPPPRVQRILIPIDFSDNSQDALDAALPLADLFDAKICLLHVQASFGRGWDLTPSSTKIDVLSEIQNVLVSRLKDVTAAIRGDRRDVQIEIRRGIPAEEIVAAAEENRADMIVMGTHGRTGLSHVLIGSVAEKVVRRAPCPVITVKSPSLVFTSP